MRIEDLQDASPAPKQAEGKLRLPRHGSIPTKECMGPGNSICSHCFGVIIHRCQCPVRMCACVLPGREIIEKSIN